MAELNRISWTDPQHRPRLELLAKTFDKSIKLYTKDNWFCRAIAWILCTLYTIITLGFKRYDREAFFTRFATTIANYHFYPKEWSPWQVETTLPHEGRHTKQLKWMGYGLHPLLGLSTSLPVYAFLPIPIGLAYGRFYMELDAERTTWKWKLENNIITPSEVRTRAESFATTVAGPAYFYCWPKSWAIKKFKKEAEEVINEYQQKTRLG